MRARTWSPAWLIALLLLGAACRRDRPAAAVASAAAAPTDSVNTSAPSAPATYRARFETTAGVFVIEVQRDWAPRGADRFYELVKSGYFDGQRFFRVLSGFMAQFGIHGDPKVSAVWRARNIPDDPVRQSNTRGMVSFATAGPGTRTTQVFINYGDNSALDGQGFAPFGRVVEGMEVVDRLFAGYGEGAPRGGGPDQGRIQGEGNAYLAKQFPKLDSVKRATIVAP
jgi:peptidyl-prolyl cis-trans isomerase A (cyclophilin A)